MKAAVYTQYGPPEVAKLTETPKPNPKENEILVKVYASTVNRTDSGFRSAEYFISRFWSGLLKPKYQILGCEFAGIIEEIGSTVTTFKIGDKVFGFNDKSFGGHGEYLTIPETAAVTTMPSGSSFNEAAALTEGSHYALVDIKAAKVERGQNVLVNGATGAIGSAAVQLLKHFGAHVTAVCNTKNVALVKSLGADVVIDYQTEDFTKTETKFPERWSVWATVGRLLVEHFQEIERGCQVSEQGTQLQPQLADAWFRHGRVLALAGKHQEAVQVLEKGWRFLPAGGYLQSVPAAVWLGESYQVLRDVGASKQWWEAACEGCQKLRAFNPPMAIGDKLRL